MERIATPLSQRMPGPPGARPVDGGVDMSVWSRNGEHIWFCLFDDAGGREIARWRLAGRTGDVHHGFIPGVGPGARYGLRADGPWQPEKGHRFDPAKLLVDPYAARIDRPFAHAWQLCAPRASNIDTAEFVPRAIIETALMPGDAPGRGKKPCTFIYETGVKAFTQRHPDVPLRQRGTLAGLAHPSAIEHLVRLGVSHVELMPIAAWIDERHLPALGLSNAWGYNPVTFMALDPRLAPAGIDDLRDAVNALHAAGIGVILDVVFNHTGESDHHGATLSLRGLDNAIYFRHRDGEPINDSGCGNTLACDREPVMQLVLDCLKHYVRQARVDGFRFDLATVLGRTENGFDAHAPLLRAIKTDPELAGVKLIAEPWDTGAGGYQAGAFGGKWREWNDRYRDDVRRFWRGDAGATGAFATSIAGSSDIFEHTGRKPSASINFIAAHDGFSLRDLVSYQTKHNPANGENNGDGQDENYSWNCGVEGNAPDAIMTSRDRDIRAMLATLFFSRGTPMLTAGDEFGRTQSGNNNAYAQDNETTWLDWENADWNLAELAAQLVKLRNNLPAFQEDRFLSGAPLLEGGPPDAAWLRADGASFGDADWREGEFLALALAVETPDRGISRVYIAFNRGWTGTQVMLPSPGAGGQWELLFESSGVRGNATVGFPTHPIIGPRGVALFRSEAPAENE